MTEDPYRALREWVDPQTGGTLPRDMRNAIIRLLAEQEPYSEGAPECCQMRKDAQIAAGLAEQRAEAAEAERDTAQSDQAAEYLRRVASEAKVRALRKALADVISNHCPNEKLFCSTCGPARILASAPEPAKEE